MYNKNARDELSSETAYRTVQTFVNDLRKYKNQYNEKNSGAWRPTVARCRGPDVIFFLYLSIVFFLGFPILPYALSFYWHFVLRPLHFIIFF